MNKWRNYYTVLYAFPYENLKNENTGKLLTVEEFRDKILGGHPEFKFVNYDELTKSDLRDLRSIFRHNFIGFLKWKTVNLKELKFVHRINKTMKLQVLVFQVIYTGV